MQPEIQLQNLIFGGSSAFLVTVSPVPMFSYSPASGIIKWTDKNGAQSGNLANFYTSANLVSVSSADLSLQPVSQITSISGIAALGALTSLNLNFDAVTSIDVSGNPVLVTLTAVNCPLTSLALNSAITSLTLSTLALSSLNLAGQTKLVTLNITSGNNLSSLTGISGNPNLTSLTLYSNPLLNTVDCHGCPNLSTFSTDNLTQIPFSNLNASGCGITNTASTYYINNLLNRIWAWANANGIHAGTIDISGGTNAVPSTSGPNGVQAITNLQTLPFNWVIHHN